MWSFWIQSSKEHRASYELSIRPLGEKLLKSVISNLNYYDQKNTFQKNYHFPKKTTLMMLAMLLWCMLRTVFLIQFIWGAPDLHADHRVHHRSTLNSESSKIQVEKWNCSLNCLLIKFLNILLCDSFLIRVYEAAQLTRSLKISWKNW